MTCVTVGKPLPLAFQVKDGNGQLMVFANLIDQWGKVYLRVPMLHASDGLYFNFETPMPELPYLVAQYVTSKLTDYEIGMEIFESVPMPSSEKYLLGEVVAISKSSEYIYGEVQHG